MKEIRPPLRDPDRRWVRAPDWYYHIGKNEEGEPMEFISDRRDKRCWIADVHRNFMVSADQNLQGDARVICLSFRFFGQDSLIQLWGFSEEFNKKDMLSAGSRAVCFEGKWFLVEKRDRLFVEADDTRQVLDRVSIIVESPSGTKSVLVKKSAS
ncbi:MAG: hypothetical protein AAB389_01625 [Patescibacteria group bacterium]